MYSMTAVLAIALGILICFFGYRVLRVTLAIAGFGVGALLGGGVVGMIPGTTQIVVLIAAGVFGVLGAIFSAVLYKVGVFLLGAGGGALVAGLVVTAIGGTATTLVLVIAGVVGGILALLLQRVVVSALTSFGGAWAVVAGSFHLLGWYDIQTGLLPSRAVHSPGPHFYLMVAIWLGLGILGAIVQGLTRRRKN